MFQILGMGNMFKEYLISIPLTTLYTSLQLSQRKKIAILQSSKVEKNTRMAKIPPDSSNNLRYIYQHLIQVISKKLIFLIIV